MRERMLRGCGRPLRMKAACAAAGGAAWRCAAVTLALRGGRRFGAPLLPGVAWSPAVELIEM